MKSKWFKHILFCMVIISILLTYAKNVMPFSGSVHKRITEEAILQNKAEISNYITGYTGLNAFRVEFHRVKILAKIKDSNSDEDLMFSLPLLVTIMDSLYGHFYNPLTNAAFTSWPGNLFPSAYARANDSSNQYSWPNARLYFYQGLTSSSDMDRMSYFYKAFEALGHVVHLLQDVAVPAHTRLDLHGVPSDLFEGYTSAIEDDLVYEQVPYKGSILNSMIPNAPLQLWDGDFYTATSLPAGSNKVGLAEYSAANFVSADTIFKEQPRPSLIDDTDCVNKVLNTSSASFVYIPINIPGPIGASDRRMYVSKISGDPVNKLAAFSILTNATKLKGIAQGLSGNEICKKLVFLLDDAIHDDYAATLVPRAVGYSKTLMDHFFNSQIEISLPDNGVYASVPNNGSTYPYPNMNFTQITLKAKNILLSGEDMSGGDVTLVVTYRIAKADPFVTGPVDVTYWLQYAIATKSNIAIPKNNPVQLTFDLTNTPIPILATDVYLQLAYKGKIGLNSDEVAFGYKDISEPTPADFFNNMDKICLNNNWYDAGSPAALAALVLNTSNRIASFWDVYAHNARNFYLRLSTLNNPIKASSTENIASIPSLFIAGEHIRLLYFLSDYDFNYSLRYSAASTAAEDTVWHSSTVYLFQGAGIKRQTDFVQNYSCNVDLYNCYVQRYPAFYKFRNVDMWSGSGAILANEGYPANYNCPLSQLNHPRQVPSGRYFAHW
ncbi:conserved hypothetical protein, secreted [Candidatus Magnetobacterium bavaricum]|uniref:Uncharacterized protein n=1 Tax=Candidatus Magnetobacterium bavaricum TaxID=29290 RepID=A0A0F3GZT3_9BACT|nr:conserved hypothetical protein, secreted [Candidatus Magnetobacterium bavaricum]